MKRSKKKPLKKKKTVARTRASRKKAALRLRKLLGPTRAVEMVTFQPKGLGARSAGQSGDLQGISGMEEADSESVEELLEEGNAFEADAVQGVEDAGAAEEAEVIAHEVLEDDVPLEYLDEK
jgi:N utilization substance protein A